MSDIHLNDIVRVKLNPTGIEIIKENDKNSYEKHFNKRFQTVDLPLWMVLNLFGNVNQQFTMGDNYKESPFSSLSLHKKVMY